MNHSFDYCAFHEYLAVRQKGIPRSNLASGCGSMFEWRSYFSGSLSFSSRRSFTGSGPSPFHILGALLPHHPLRGTFHGSVCSPGTFAPSLCFLRDFPSLPSFSGVPRCPRFPSLLLFGFSRFPFPWHRPSRSLFPGYVPTLPSFVFCVRISVFFLSEYRPFLCQDEHVPGLSLFHATLHTFTHTRTCTHFFNPASLPLHHVLFQSVLIHSIFFALHRSIFFFVRSTSFCLFPASFHPFLTLKSNLPLAPGSFSLVPFISLSHIL